MAGNVMWLRGCQIFLDKHTKTGQNVPENIPNGHKIYHMYSRKVYQMDMKYTIARSTKIYPNLDFGFGNIPSGIPVWLFPLFTGPETL
jgi:hypothetical protein